MIRVELLERHEALTILRTARASAARGAGRVVVVSGEPGIGKSSLVGRFVRDLDQRARVLVGTCDDLSVPRPFGPIRDLADGVSSTLVAALASGAPPHDVQGLLVAELERAPRPTVLVLEDVHWADGATLDAITVLARRIGSLPGLLVLTLRTGETPPGHPLLAAVGAIPADASHVVELAPLSRTAVLSLAGEAGDSVFAATAGNPFYVTELLAADEVGALPPSVATTVVGRVSRLEPDARGLLELLSVVPNRVSTSLLDAVWPHWADAAEEPERRQLLEVAPSFVRFRHELARNAILSSIPVVRRRRLHAEILAALLVADADPAQIVHHADAAGATDVVADHVLVAARRAAAAEANREAFSHYLRASDLAERLPPGERGALLEERAQIGYLVNRNDDALDAIAQAIEVYRAAGDTRGVGRCTRLRSRLEWAAVDGEGARASALEAIAILEPLGPTVELARAYAGLSQLAMLADDLPEAIEIGARAVELATSLGDLPTRALALVNIGSARLLLDPADRMPLLEAHEAALEAGDAHEATRALLNLAFTLFTWIEPAAARTYTEQALVHSGAHEVHGLDVYTRLLLVWLDVRHGVWDGAERAIGDALGQGESVQQLLAQTIHAELAIRRGDPTARLLLTALADQAGRSGELQRTVPVLELEVEWALLHGEPQPLARIESIRAQIEAQDRHGSAAAHVQAWAAVAGLAAAPANPTAEAHAAMARRDWHAAADAFGAVGWRYDRALLLSLTDDEPLLAEALEIARELGAEPLVRRVAERMREGRCGYRPARARRPGRTPQVSPPARPRCSRCSSRG